MRPDGPLVLLTGATGLVGSSVIQKLLAAAPDTRIRAVYHSRPPLLQSDPRVEYVEADLRHLEACRRVARGCGSAIMAAANTGGAAQLSSEPWVQVNDNAVMNVRMLEACQAEKVRRVLYISSATAYQPASRPISEDELDLCQDPHAAHFGIGWVLRFTEKLCQFWHQSCGMEVLIARATNVFGPYARFDPRTSNFIPALIRKAVDRMDPFEVWGSPEVTRDVIYSEDFALALVAMLDNSQVKFDTFNIGSGERTTIADAVGWALKHAGHTPSEVRYVAGASTVPFRAVDCAKARRLLGWQPSLTVEQGIEKTTAWWQENRHWWAR